MFDSLALTQVLAQTERWSYEKKILEYIYTINFLPARESATGNFCKDKPSDFPHAPGA